MFQTLHQACAASSIWRLDYNEVRPHSSLGAFHWRGLPRCIASGLAIRFGLRSTPTISINLQLGLPLCNCYGGRGQVKSCSQSTLRLCPRL